MLSGQRTGMGKCSRSHISGIPNPLPDDTGWPMEAPYAPTGGTIRGQAGAQELK